MNELTFRHDEQSRRFVADFGGAEVAHMEVDVIGGESFLLKHTEVDPAHEGKGYGSALIRHVLAQARSQGRTVMPICPFAATYIVKHAEYADLVKPDFRGALPQP
jgi:predicted GNAT family acetyltransferase